MLSGASYHIKLCSVSRFQQIVYLPVISQYEWQKPIHRMAQKKQDMSHSGDWLPVFLWGGLDNQRPTWKGTVKGF